MLARGSPAARCPERVALLVLCCAGCFDFSGALGECHDAGRCLTGRDAGSASDGGSTDAGPVDGGSTAQMLPPLHVEPVSYDGGLRWEFPAMGSMHFNAVWVNGDDDWWVAGDDRTLLHWDGQRLRPVFAGIGTGQSFTLLIGLGDAGAMLLGDRDGNVLQRFGDAWLLVPHFGEPPPHDPRVCRDPASGAIWFAGDNAFAVLDGGVLQWRPITGFPVTLALTAFAMVSPTAGFAAYNNQFYAIDAGGVLGTVDLSSAHVAGVDALGAAAPGRAIAGVSLALGGKAVVALEPTGVAGAVALPSDLVRGVTFAPEPGDVLVAANGGIFRLPADLSAAPTSPEHLASLPTAIHAAGHTAVEAGYYGELAVARRGTWEDVTVGGRTPFARAAASSETMIALGATGTYAVARSADGGTWRPIAAPACAGCGPAVVTGAVFSGTDFFVSTLSAVVRLVADGGWSTERQVGGEAYTAMASAGADVWVGLNDGILHRDAMAAWHPEAEGVGSITRLAAWSPQRVWAISASGALWSRLADGGWGPEPLAGGQLDDVAVTSSSVYLLADDGGISCRGRCPSGTSWPSSSACSERLLALETDGGDTLIASGGARQATVCLYPPGRASQVPIPIPSPGLIRDLLISGERVWAFGDNGSVLSLPLP